MKLLGRLVLPLALVTLASILSGPLAATESSSGTATAVVQLTGDPDTFSCQPVCPNSSPTSPLVPPVPVSSLAECEAVCRTQCHVSSCSLTTPPLDSGASGSSSNL